MDQPQDDQESPEDHDARLEGFLVGGMIVLLLALGLDALLLLLVHLLGD